MSFWTKKGEDKPFLLCVLFAFPGLCSTNDPVTATNTRKMMLDSSFSLVLTVHSAAYSSTYNSAATILVQLSSGPLQ